MKKLLIIGLDGATLDIIEKNLDKLPNFKKILKKSSYGKMKSTIPPLTIPAWPIMFSGKNPGEYGAYEFRRLKRKQYDFGYANSNLWNDDMLWQLVSRENKKCVILNVPGTYPAHKLNGFMRTGMMSINEKKMYYPTDFEYEINKLYTRFGERKNLESFVGSEQKKKESMKNFNIDLKVTLELLKSKDWDLFITVFRLPDVFIHYGSSNEELVSAYEYVDEKLEGILNLAEKEDYNVLIVSDHGSKKVDYFFYINNWLKKKGYLTVKESKLESAKQLIIQKLINSGFRFTLQYVAGILKKIKGEKRLFINKPKDIFKNIVWDKTKAFSFSSAGGNSFVGIWLNTDIFPDATIENKTEYNDIREKLILDIKRIKDENGKKIIKNIYKREEIFSGNDMELMPDLVVETIYEYVSRTHMCPHIIAKTKDRFFHELHGVLIAFGPDIKPNHHINDAKICDIAPTILHMLESKIPNKLDGVVLKSIFTTNSKPAKKGIQYMERDAKKELKLKLKKIKRKFK